MRRVEGGNPAPRVTPCEEKVTFIKGFVPRFLGCLESEVPETERRAILEGRGRSCARRGPVRFAREAGGDPDKLLATMAGWLGPEGARRDGDVIHIRYAKCLCPLVGDLTEALPKSFCDCSVGWLKEMFETASGRKVEVLALETIRRGGAACRFEIRTEA
jgi:hypothetical protein